MITYEDSKGNIHEKKYDTGETEIHLSNKNIKKILNISGLANLQKLYLEDNQITQITEITGLDKLSSLQELFLHDNRITEIKGLDNLSSLRVLSLSNNDITEIKELDMLTSLEILCLYRNKIAEIKGLDKLTSLQSLLLFANKIKEIKGLDAFRFTLQRLLLNDNDITEIKELNGFNTLIQLDISENQITEIKGLDELNSLRVLSLYKNQITEIKGLDGLTNIQNIQLTDNKITEVPFTIMNLRNLSTLNVDCKIDTILERFLNKNKVINKLTIYNDAQNVHDTTIVKSVKESIYKIMLGPEKVSIDDTLKNIIDDGALNESVKEQLIEYCQDKTVHSVLNLTFSEVLCSVWKVISEHKESDEIKNILNTEMKDSICVCFTGRLSRLVNCLNGFDDRVSINISDKQEILNVIINVRNKYDSVEEQRKEVIKELTERGFDKNIIDAYLVFLE